MSNGILEGRPEQIGGNTKASWHKLTDSDIEGVWGKRDQFLRALQENMASRAPKPSRKSNSV